MLEGSKKQTCVSEPHDQGSARLATHFFIYCLQWLPKLNSLLLLSDQPKSVVGCLPRWLVKQPNFAAVAKNLPAFLLVWISHTYWGNTIKQRWHCKKNTPSAHYLSQQISTQGYRPGYADYFLISASVSYEDSGCCLRSNKPNIQRQEKQKQMNN